MAWYSPTKPEPRRPVGKPRSRTKMLKAELALEEAEDDFVEKKAAGKLTRQDRLDLRERRKAFRLKHRKPVEPGQGAAPGPIVVATQTQGQGEG